MDLYAQKHKDQEGKSAFKRESENRPFKDKMTLGTKKPITKFTSKPSKVINIGDKYKFSLQ